MSRSKLLVIVGFLFLIGACSDSELVNMKELSNGAKLYKSHCANCHQEDGSGLANLIPPLKHSDYLKSHAAELPCIITHGLQGEILVNGKMYQMKMVPVKGLKPEDVKDLCTYVLQKFPQEPIGAEVWQKSLVDSCF